MQNWLADIPSFLGNLWDWDLKEFIISTWTIGHMHKNNYINANPCFSEVSGAGWGILLCKDFA